MEIMPHLYYLIVMFFTIFTNSRNSGVRKNDSIEATLQINKNGLASMSAMANTAVREERVSLGIFFVHIYKPPALGIR